MISGAPGAPIERREYVPNPVPHGMMATIEGASQIEMARILAVRTALRLEIQGMKRHGRSARVLANEIMGTSHSTAKKAYVDLNARIASVLGPEFNKPLKTIKEGENRK